MKSTVHRTAGFVWLCRFGFRQRRRACMGQVPDGAHDRPGGSAKRRAGVRQLLFELPCRSNMRYNRLRDIGLSEDQIKKNLLFATEKVGDTMKVALDPKQAKEWFGAVPPDLSVIARSRADISKGSGADYLYTYLRSYYRDPNTATGWNNLAFPNVGMPHVLWELQGQRSAKFVDEKDAHDPCQERAPVRRVSGALGRQARCVELRRKPSPTWSPTCSGWVSPRRASACGLACGS